MDDRQPQAEALRSAVARIGSQAATARLLGVAQPSVWRWLSKGQPLPAEHVLKVEIEMKRLGSDISRHDLRPDLYPRDAAAPPPHASAPSDGMEPAR